MKTYLPVICSVCSIVICFFSLSGFAASRPVTLNTKSIDGVMHWAPAEVKAMPGETLTITAQHDLEGGFDFHGLMIPALKITKQVNRHKPEIFKLKIPKDMKPGRYPIGCQFHEKHVAAELVIEEPAKK